MSKKYILLCDYCNWKKISDLDSFGVVELKNDTMSGKKFRCPSCGRAISPKKITDPQSELDKKIEEERISQENKKWMDESINFQIEFNKGKTDEH